MPNFVDCKVLRYTFMVDIYVMHYVYSGMRNFLRD